MAPQKESHLMQSKMLIFFLLISLAGLVAGYSQDQKPGPESSPAPQIKAAATSSPYVLPPDDQRETARLNDLCQGLLNSYECAQAIERAQLPRYPRQTARDQDRLKLTLKNGKTVILKNTPGVSGVSYSFRDYLPDLGYFLVHVQLWEGDAYLMVNDRTGQRRFIHDLPIISPDKTRLVTISMDLEAQYNPNAIQVWRLTPGKMVREWSRDIKGWGPAGGAWLDNDTISLIKKIPKGDYSGYVDVPLLLKKGPDGWKLTEK
jgi:hypothetical protein